MGVLGSEDREYIAMLFYQNRLGAIGISIQQHKIHLVVIQNTEAHITVRDGFS